MKREARQHGMVRTYRVLPSPWNPKPETPSIRRLDSSPAARLFSNVPSKRSNHSKCTGKCSRPQCLERHLNPVSKSKKKSKGTQKLKTRNIVQKLRLITWRVVDRQPSLNFSGFSATGILEHLRSADEGDEIDHDDYVDDVNEYDDGGPCGLVDADHADNVMANFWALQEMEYYHREVEIEEYVGGDDDDDDDAMSFCDVGFILEQADEDEGWCFLREI